MVGRITKGADGLYSVSGSKYRKLEGSRREVHNGTAYKTSGGLIKKDILLNKNGRIVSALKHKTAKKERRLERHGFFAQKGKFGMVRRPPRARSSKSKTRTRRRRTV